MLETKRPLIESASRMRRQQGSTAIEFGLILVAFLTVVFFIVEVARIMFLFNTLQEVTRRAAAAASNTDFTNTGKMDEVRQNAIFRAAAGELILMPGLTDQSVRIDYLSVARDNDGNLSLVPISATNLPSSPAANRRGCLIDPNSATCIRVVRARVCQSGIAPDCEPMQYHSFVPLFSFAIALPRAPTLARAQSLGI